jgi:hypothetical protein
VLFRVICIVVPRSFKPTFCLIEHYVEYGPGPRKSEINDDDEQDTVVVRQIKTDQKREIRGQTSPAIIIIVPTTINHPSKQRNGAYSYANRFKFTNLQCGRPTKKEH